MIGEWREALGPLRVIFSNYWAQSRATIAIVLGLTFVSSVATVGTAWVFARLVDRIAQGATHEAFLYAFLGYAAILGVIVTIDDSLSYLTLMCARNLEYVITTSFFGRLLKKKIDFFVLHNPAEIQNAQICGEEALNDLFGLALSVFIPGVTQIVLSLLMLGATIKLDLVWVVIAYGVAFVALTAFANERTRARLSEATEASQENAQFVGNAVNSMETLRHFGSERWMNDRFAQKASVVRNAWLSFCFVRMSFTGVFGLMLATEFGLTYFLLLPDFEAGRLSVGDIVLFNSILLQLNHPFEMVGRSANQLVQTLAHFQPFLRMWLAPEEPPARLAQHFGLTQGRIVFDDVGFDYEGGGGVAGLSFVAERGRATYLVGETGAGKSTTLRLALKSLEPTAGRILVDGADLRDVARDDWFAAIGVVPQEVILLNDSLATNIVLGRPLCPDRLRRAAEKAAILDFVDSLPDGFDTNVGERGLRLSGGERQRIAIARALYAEPAILFLDEASSALDAATEDDILSHLRALAREVTIVAITHRETVIAPGDRIVRMSEGRIVDVEEKGEA
jgi:ATP-binding cassette, subfamily B, bacterial